MNQAESYGPQGQGMWTTLERDTKAIGESCAISGDAARLAVTYSVMWEDVCRWSTALVDAGVRPETLVGVALPRGADLWIAMLAIHRAGGAMLPIDSAQPVERVRDVLTRSGCTFLIISPETESFVSTLLDKIPDEERLRVLTMSSLRAARLERNATIPVVGSNLSYVIYTSGSTGVPKGAMITHDGMLNHLACKCEDLPLTSSDVVAQTASQAVDVSIWQFLAVLLVGGRVEIIPDEVGRDPLPLLARAAESGVTILEIVPSFFHVMLATLERQSALPNLGKLRIIIVNGEVLPPEQCTRWFRLYPNVEILNAYGPTECSDDVTHFHMTSAAALSGPRVPIGRPLRNLRLHVLDDELQPVAADEAGEIFVAGTGVGRGYLGDPAQTARIYVPDPFGAPGSRMYRTGDRGRWLPDGTLDFLGRRDTQVKVRGFRVELGEIEAAIERHPSIERAVVVATTRRGMARVTAFCVMRGNERLDKKDLAAHLRELVPEYMIPSAFIERSDMPLLTSGKLDRKALAATLGDEKTEEESPSLQDEIPSQASIEEQLLAIWKELLGDEVTDVEQNFFELGGHSLLAVQMIGRIRSLYGIEFPLRTIFDSPTVKELAEAVLRALPGEEKPAAGERRFG